jgi:SsrA-binding protein
VRCSAWLASPDCTGVRAGTAKGYAGAEEASLFFQAAGAYMAMTMVRPTPPAFDKKKIVAENRRARFEYFIEDVYEAGIALTGTEVKSLRFGEGSIAESYAEVKDGEVWLVNSNVPEFSHGNRYNHEPKRPRKLLLKEREIARFTGAVERKGMTLVPLSVYFNGRGRAKVELALAKGKNNADKRATIKDRDWQRDKARIMREHG